MYAENTQFISHMNCGLYVSGQLVIFFVTCYCFVVTCSGCAERGCNYEVVQRW